MNTQDVVRIKVCFMKTKAYREISSCQESAQRVRGTHCLSTAEGCRRETSANVGNDEMARMVCCTI